MHSMRSIRRQRGFWQYLIPAAAAAFGSIMSRDGQQEANETNLNIAHDQMAFQERMSNTAYQRATADMRKAGINPMLAVQQGGASSPPGATTRVENTLSAFAGSAQQAAALIGAASQAQMSQAQADLANAQAEKVRTETYDKALNTAQKVSEVGTASWEESKRSAESTTAWNEAKRRRIAAEIDAEVQRDTVAQRKGESQMAVAGGKRELSAWEADVARRRAQARLLELEIPKSQQEAKFWDSKGGEMAPWLKPILQIINAINSGKRAFGSPQ